MADKVGFWRRLTGRNGRVSRQADGDGRQLVYRFGDVATGSGVDPIAFYRGLPSIYAATRLRADVISQTRLVVGTLETNGEWRRASGTATGAVLAGAGMVRALSELETALCLYGRGYWVLDLDAGNGDFVLRPVWPDRMSHDRSTGMYQERTDAAMTDWPASRVLDFSYADLGGGNIPCPFTAAYSAATVALNANRYNATFFQNAARPDFAIITEQPLTTGDIDDFYAKWDERFQGRSFRPAIMGGVRDIRPMGINHTDMDFLNGLIFGVEEVCRAFGVPPPMLADYRQASLSNVRASERFFFRNTVLPEMLHIAARVSAKLPDFFRETGYQVGLDNSHFRDLWEAQVDSRRQDVNEIQHGLMTINEVRRLRGMPDVEWGNAPPGGRDEQAA